MAMGCAGPKAFERHDQKTRALFDAQTTPAQGTIHWEVLNRFRLLKQDESESGGPTSESEQDPTRELFYRYESYHETVQTQVNKPLLPTWWDVEKGQYAKGYLEPSHWRVRLTAPFAGNRCEWTIGAESPVPDKPCSGFEARVRKGEPKVSVRSQETGESAQGLVQPRDVLIASLGDSYASGEGVPDMRRYHGWKFWNWVDAQWMDKTCHRSLFSGPGLAALMYAAINPHVSVTHVTFACSGAELKAGILHPYAGAEPKRRGTLLPSQIEALQAALAGTGRTPDFLTLSAGGNDVGFADIVSVAVFDGKEEVRKTIAERVLPGAESVRAALPVVRCALATAGVEPSRTTVLLTEYPDPTRLLRLEAAIATATPKQRSECGGRDGES
jgi:hypothetical protein